MRNFMLFVATGYLTTVIGFGMVLVPGWLYTHSFYGAMQTVVGFTLLMGTAPILVHALVLSILLHKRA